MSIDKDYLAFIEQQRVTATTTDAHIDRLAEAMWPVIQAPPEYGKTAFSLVALAYRTLMQGDVEPAQAVRIISTIALTASGLKFDEVPGTRVRPR